MSDVTGGVMPAPAAAFRSTRYRRVARRRIPAALSLALLGALFIAALLAPWLAPYDPVTINVVERLRPPGADHLFGTDALGRDILAQIRKVFGDKVFRTVISKSVRLEESPAYRESIFTFAPDSSGANEYYSLCEEVIERA